MNGDVLQISRRAIRGQGTTGVLAACWRQWCSERRLKGRGLHFRATDTNLVARIYSSMCAEEFAAVNARQEWANWRTIPRCLNGHVPQHPLRVLDLGCGCGCSTQVLAYYCPSGSHITGFELVKPLLELARQRDYRHHSGRLAKVDFCCQGICEPFSLPDHSVDLVNASGIVGHHLDAQSIRPLVGELGRLLVPGGIAQLDVGPTLAARKLRQIMAQAGFLPLGRFRSWLLDPTGQMVFQFPPADCQWQGDFQGCLQNVNCQNNR